VVEVTKWTESFVKYSNKRSILIYKVTVYYFSILSFYSSSPYVLRVNLLTCPVLPDMPAAISISYAAVPLFFSF